MAGPGGDEVARVAVRVVPDSSGFRSELARELAAIEQSMKVEIPVEADTSGLRAEVGAAVAALSGEDIDVDVEADTAGARAETQAFVAATQALDAQIDVDADTAGARAEASATRAAIDAMKATIEVKVDVDKAGLGGIGDGIGGGRRGGGLFGALTGALTEIPSLATGAATAVSSFGQSATGAFGGALQGANGFVGAIFAGIPIIGQLLGAMAQLAFTTVSVGVAIGVIGGAITALVGAIGAAVSGLPALLLGVAAAGATVALGMDGIKKAAEAAVPGLNKLKAAVSTVFEKQLTPIFRDLGERVFPQLTLGLQTLASHVGGFAAGLIAVATTADGIANLNAIFQGMGVLLQTMMPAWQGLLAVFLDIGATSGVWQVLGELISSVVNRVAELFARFAAGGESSLMIQALTQFKNVLDAALGAINELILGATEFFTGAGPGLRDMFASIEEAIKKIDFRSLGESFGSFARTVGQFIEAIPQSTWDALAEAVQKVAEQFALLAEDPAVQQFFVGLVNIIPLAVEAFAGFLAMIRNVVAFMREWVGASLSALASVAEGVNTFVQAMPGIPDSVRNATAGAAGLLRGFADTFNAESQRAAEAPGVHAPTALAGGQALGSGAAQGAQAGVAPMPGQMGAEAARAAEAVRGQGQNANGAGNAVGAGALEGATKGIAPMPDMSANRTTEAVGRVMAEAGAANAAGNAVGSGAHTGAQAGIAPMPGDMRNTTVDAKNAVGGEAPGFNSVGGDLAAGLARGIASGASAVIGAAIDIAVQAFNAAKRALGIASPSKLFRDEIGFQVAAGMAVGIGAGAPSAVKAATAMVAQVSTAAQRSMAADPGLKAAAQELLTRMLGGGQLFEDLSYKGMSANLARFNDELVDMFAASGKSLQDFLSGLAASSSAVKAGQSVGQQIAAGMTKALSAYTIKAPTISTPGSQSQAYDYITDQARASYQAGIWGGTKSSIGAQPRNQQQGGGDATAALLAALERGLKLDTEQGEVIAKLNNMGQRTLARR